MSITNSICLDHFDCPYCYRCFRHQLALSKHVKCCSNNYNISFFAWLINIIRIRNRRDEENLCYFCHNSEHQVFECPKSIYYNPIGCA